MITFCRYDKAPKELQTRCDCGGDEDWIIIVPKTYVNDDVPFDIWDAIYRYLRPSENNDPVYTPMFGWLQCVGEDDKNWYVVATHA